MKVLKPIVLVLTDINEINLIWNLLASSNNDKQDLLDKYYHTKQRPVDLNRVDTAALWRSMDKQMPDK